MDEIDNHSPEPYSKRYLKYRQLKDQLKVVADLPEAQRKEGENTFLLALQVQVQEVNRCCFLMQPALLDSPSRILFAKLTGYAIMQTV